MFIWIGNETHFVSVMIFISIYLTQVQLDKLMQNITCKCGQQSEDEPSSFVVTIPLLCLKSENCIKCERYNNCRTCMDGHNKCVSCPDNKFGRWCHKACKCRNGGRCLQNGDCTCPKAYTGSICQKRNVKYRRMRSTLAHDITCPAPTIPANGKAEIEFAILIPGDTVKYHCNEGFTLVGSATRRCLDSARWSDDKPSCERLCPFPTISSHEGMTYTINPGREEKDQERDASGNIIVRELLFTCAEYYVLVGADRLRCLSGGTWDRDPPTCARSGAKSCPDPGIPEHGQRLPPNISLYLSGSVLRFWCNDDFQLIGYSMVVCTESGTWTTATPQCTSIATAAVTESDSTTRLCPVPSAPEFGSVSLETPDFSLESRYHDSSFLRVHARINYKCDNLYVLDSYPTRRCLTSGRWSGREPKCIPLCGKVHDPKIPLIINGTTADFKGWPWQVALSSSALGLYCAGTVISPRWVITAAHCITNEVLGVEVLYVILGKHYRNNNMDDSNVVTRKAEELIIHPHYGQNSRPSFDSDIGLIMMNEPVKFNERIRPLCLPGVYSRATFQNGNLGLTMGWGLNEKGESSDELVYVKLPVVPSDKCEENYRRSHINARVTENMFCAGYDEGGRNTCRGDSGGAMAFDEGESGDPRFVLEGIVSWGYEKGCATPGFYGGFVRVRNFVPWIRSVVDDSI